ncbi:hypothetical protein C8R44DRAFT_192520 [Mycena epipterygia]|nr:hypothetical protein C8R44DRAFT_192520 [Mycena epipterygia]
MLYLPVCYILIMNSASVAFATSYVRYVHGCLATPLYDIPPEAGLLTSTYIPSVVPLLHTYLLPPHASIQIPDSTCTCITFAFPQPCISTCIPVSITHNPQSTIHHPSIHPSSIHLASTVRPASSHSPTVQSAL